jgi:TonB family protein
MRIEPALVSILAASLAVTPLPAAGQDTFPDTLAAGPGATRLEPVIPWNIDFGENRCRLTRIFGSEADRHLLMFEQAAPGQSFGLTIAGSNIANFRTAGKVDLGMERDEPMKTKDEFGKGQIADLGPALIFSNVGIGRAQPAESLRGVGIDLTEAATIDRVVLRRGKDVLSFETGNMAEALAALNSCTDDLLKQWGLDADAHKNHVPPVWTNEALVTQRIVAVYPTAARSVGEQAIFRMRVTVETDGSVSDCLIEESTVTRRLESPACKEMRRAQFEPARDAQAALCRDYRARTVGRRDRSAHARTR